MIDRKNDRFRAESDVRLLRKNYRDLVSNYAVRYEVSQSPRESFIAERHQRIGQIDGEHGQLVKLREQAVKLEALEAEKTELEGESSRLEARQKALTEQNLNRRARALSRISSIACNILATDLPRQDEFQEAKKVEVNFRDNSMLVDGILNFAESSNVIVKNASILALLLAAVEDQEFFHPRFLLMDNIEDKGMEQDRSHNFQKIITDLSMAAKEDHQIIFTTSKLNPQLDSEDYIVGREYTNEKRTLKL